MTVTFIIIILVYLLVIGLLVYGFNKVTDFHLRDIPSKTKFTVLIPFRNEVDNLPTLLDSLSKLNYPSYLYEIIMIDDASSDGSKASIEKLLSQREFQKLSKFITVIDNNRFSKSPKKDAIVTGISIAKHPWILTTDADCTVPKYWLESFDEHIQTHNPDCLVGPVKFTGLSSFFTRFQILDTISLQGATIGGFGLKIPFLCNGANFGYRISAFNMVNGFDGNTDIASGDDIFLMDKFLKHKSLTVNYLKTDKAIVRTNVASNLKELISQRVRWASKTSKSKNHISKLIGLIIAFTNIMLVALVPLALYESISLKSAGFIFLLKFSIDLLHIFKASRFFNQEPALLSYPFASLFYPIFSSYVFFISLFSKYQWKGRRFKK
ncbi:glycosyltransferase [Winogradskyella sp. A3E31]|uniref:glycosyltransferase n=1 Tax=Winogradskyella sp. A3E31 TaxID=3349637 RepID=UPI00398AD8DF